MPITNPGFGAANDLHVLRGTPPISLSKLLSVTWSTGPDQSRTDSYFAYLTQSGGARDVDIQFRPVFKRQTDDKKYSGFKIEILRTTDERELSVLAGPDPVPAPHSFMIEAVVVSNGGAPVPATPALLRVHVHGSVTAIWMTPDRLSIPRANAPGTGLPFYRFTVRAQFDDGTVADITATDHYAPEAADAAWFDHGAVQIPAGSSENVRTVTFVTTPAWNSRRAHGDIELLPSWATATDVPRAEFVDGPAGVLDSTVKADKMANIVFLGVGFRALDLAAFEGATNILIQRMRTDRHLTPYRYVAASMNYWRLLVPAGDPGVCVRCEVFTIASNGQLFALPMPAPVRPAGTQPWTLANLVYMAGPPTPADAALAVPDPTQPGGIDTSAVLGKWDQTMFEDPPRNVTTEVVKAWLGLGNRTFIDEVNNFPAIAVGTPPSSNPDFDDSGELVFHPFRGGGGLPGENAQRVAFFRRVAAAPRNGGTIALDTAGGLAPEVGNLWAEVRDSFTFDNQQLVVAFCNMPLGRNKAFFFARSQWIFGDGLLVRPTMEMTDLPKELPGLPVVRADGRNALKLSLPPASATKMLPETWETIAHELGHAFGLGDEYAEVQAVFDGFGPAVSFNSNLMLENDVLDANRKVPPGMIKWNWDRIRIACVITLPVDDQLNGLFRVFVAKRRDPPFEQGDVVRLRHRDPRSPLGTAPRTSIVEFVVDSVHPEHLGKPDDPLNMTIVVKNEAIGIDASPFGPGSIIFAPVLAPPERRLVWPYLTLVSPAAERIMDAIGGTMSGKDCDVRDKSYSRARVQVPRLPLDQLAQLAPLHLLPRMVGVYFGGAKYACGVVHPAGSCIMRTGLDSFSLFCAACQYALVERIDPEQHGRLDADYDADYLL